MWHHEDSRAIGSRETLDQQLYLPEDSLAIKDEHFAFPGRFTMTSVNESELVAIVENSVRMPLDDLCFALAQGRNPDADRRPVFRCAC